MRAKLFRNGGSQAVQLPAEFRFEGTELEVHRDPEPLPGRSGALAAYQKGLAIAEALAQRDPANAQWQVDVAVSCAKMGSLDSLLSINDRRDYLQRGRQLLLMLKDAGRLHANQDWIGWFDQALEALQ